MPELPQAASRLATSADFWSVRSVPHTGKVGVDYIRSYNALDADTNTVESDNNALDADSNAPDADNNTVESDNNALDADNNASKKGCGGHCQPTIVQCYPAPTPM